MSRRIPTASGSLILFFNLLEEESWTTDLQPGLSCDDLEGSNETHISALRAALLWRPDGCGRRRHRDAPLLLFPRAQTKPTDAFETFLSVYVKSNKMSDAGAEDAGGKRASRAVETRQQTPGTNTQHSVIWCSCRTQAQIQQQYGGSVGFRQSCALIYLFIYLWRGSDSTLWSFPTDVCVPL